MGMGPGDIGVKRGDKAGFPQLPQCHTPETRRFQRSRAQRDERFPPGLGVVRLIRPGNPLRQHGQGSPRLLVLRERLPLTLEHRQGGRMERITNLKTVAEIFPGFRLGGAGIHSRPFRRKLRPPLKTPIRVGFGHLFPHPLAADIFKKAPPHHFADLGLIVGDEVLGHPAHHPGNFLLPLEIPVGHLHLTARQTDDRRAVRRPRRGHSQILDKSVKLLGHPPVTVQKVQHFVKEEQHRPFRGLEHAPNGFSPRGRGLGRLA